MLLTSGNTIPILYTENCWVPNNFNDINNRFSKRSKKIKKIKKIKKNRSKLRFKFSRH